MEIAINEETLKERFPELIYNKEDETIEGMMQIQCICKDEYINDIFEIKIKFFKNKIPEVFEISKKIKPSYHHLYNDGKLCLATDIEQELYLKEHDILEWIEEYVKKYFVSYIYYKRYKVFPFEEHSHGEKGIYEFLKEYFVVENIDVAKNIFEYVCTKKYRGHASCPCGSNKRLRNCHGNLILNVINGKDIEILKENYRRIENVGRNKQKAK